MDELKRCPFCGSEPIQAVRFKGKYHEVYCGNFFGCPVTPCTRLFETEEEAIEAWNRRSECYSLTKNYRTSGVHKEYMKRRKEC